MRRKTYLNGILTINAALLTGLLWVQVADQPVLANTASAQVRTSRGQAPPMATFEYTQRQKIIDELVKLGKSMEAMKKQIVSGTIKVEVSNLDQVGK